MVIRLETTLDDFESLHASITARAKSVSVPITTLNRLLIDHSRLVRTLESVGVKIADTKAADAPAHARGSGRMKQ